MLQHGTWNQIWKLFCWGPMGQGCQDPGYGVAHSPLQLLRLQRRFGDFRTLGRSWRNHTLQLAVANPKTWAHWALCLTGDSGSITPKPGSRKRFRLFFLLRTVSTGISSVGAAVACWRTPSSGSEFPQRIPQRCLCPPVDEDRCGSHEKPALLDQVPNKKPCVFMGFLHLFVPLRKVSLWPALRPFCPGGPPRSSMLSSMPSAPSGTSVRRSWSIACHGAMVPWCQGHHGHHGHLEQVSKSWEHNWMRLDLGIGCPWWVKISSDSKRGPTWPIHTHSILKNAAARRTSQRMSWPCSHPRHTHSELAVKLLR